MITKKYSVYDTKVNAYLTDFNARTNGEAIRNFSDGANDPKTQMFQHPEDFVLFEIGTFDNSNATYTNLKAPVSLGTALEFKNDN